MMELVCPAGTPAALRASVEAGAHAIYCGFADETNARNFPGLNFSREEMADAVSHAHARGAKVLVAINTFPRAGAEAIWQPKSCAALSRIQVRLSSRWIHLCPSRSIGSDCPADPNSRRSVVGSMSC